MRPQPQPRTAHNIVLVSSLAEIFSSDDSSIFTSCGLPVVVHERQQGGKSEGTWQGLSGGAAAELGRRPRTSLSGRGYLVLERRDAHHRRLRSEDMMHATPVAVLALLLELLPNLVFRRSSLSPNDASSIILSLRSSTRIYDYRGGRGIRSQSALARSTQGRPTHNRASLLASPNKERGYVLQGEARMPLTSD